MLTTRQGIRPLHAGDLSAFLELTALDPVVNVFAEYRARTTNLEPRWLGGEIWGRWDGGDLVAACHVGANLVPIQATEEDAQAFGERARNRVRTVSTIVGRQPAVRSMWGAIGDAWGAPRDQRWEQPHLEQQLESLVEPDPFVRRTVRADMETLYPACVAMYTEEVGISPETGGGRDLYRARVLQLISRGWSFARIEDGEVVFKAEVACATPEAAQIQGVWVPAHRRGEGLAARGMAAVCDIVREEIAPRVSLYVNEWNTSARRAYERAGFLETARFSTIMF
ncbi:putative GNAT family acetyltransferase [Nocardioides luteus]|uniref:N-acetyltransferase GCN5 n=1 Tax=Nocardioides luteus TaxID=1844 RepID=A0ABQ5SUR9_9ACTN|nr:GNAT family N-acetyltransferase [Nocardioides luteus]MDR7309878.1 putative GNAT family acetyltransferase [Nocardioides luteus]GGR59870.1 N-acetyltransferase GCN5 [Nocardioides luteus]GLJ67214.1 N-acetyltransferase GCN5 [Nocardioides luteus]